MTAAKVLHLTRNYHAEMRTLIDDAISSASVGDGSYSPPLVATEIVEKLQANDPDLLDGWLHAQAGEFVREAISKIGRSARARAHKQEPRRKFAAAVEEHNAGDSTALRKISDIPFPVPTGQKPLGLLNRAELVYAMGTYTQRAERNRFKAVFLGKLLQRVTDGTTVNDHFTDEQLASMYQSFGR